MVVHLPILKEPTLLPSLGIWIPICTSCDGHSSTHQKGGITDDVYHKMIPFNACLLQRVLSMVLNLKIIFYVNKCVQSKRKRKKERKLSSMREIR